MSKITDDQIIKEKLEKTAHALRKNNMEAHIAENKEEALRILKTLLKPGDKIGVGGSVTLGEIGVYDVLKSGEYQYIDRYEKGLTREQIDERFRECFFADVYLSSSNAVTENGELYNVDGHSNRIAAIAFGPKSVVIIAGYNKITGNLKEAEERVKQLAAPQNAKRLNVNTYCSAHGECRSLQNEYCEITDGCFGDSRICCNYLICAKQRVKNRIKVILVQEELGY